MNTKASTNIIDHTESRIKSFEDMEKIKPNAIVLDDDEWNEYADLFGIQPDKELNRKARKNGVLFFRGIRVIKWSKVKGLANT